MPEEIPMAGGVVSSSKQPRIDLLPTELFFRAAARFELGIERKADKAWNALSANQSCLTDKEFVLDRIGHGIGHLLKLRDKVLAGKPMEGDDDAGAVAWTAAFLCCATRALAEAVPAKNCSACGGDGLVHVSGSAPDAKCSACHGTGKAGR